MQVYYDPSAFMCCVGRRTCADIYDTTPSTQHGVCQKSPACMMLQNGV